MIHSHSYVLAVRYRPAGLGWCAWPGLHWQFLSGLRQAHYAVADSDWTDHDH
jgi:hypothetical protein